MADFRILIAGSSPQWRESMVIAFRAGSSGEVISCENCQDFIDAAARFYPDVVLWKMEDDFPPHLLQELCCYCTFPIIIVDNPNLYDITSLLISGIKGCLPSRLLPVQIVSAVELTVHAGLLCLPRMSPEIFQSHSQSAADCLKLLTPREVQILRLLGRQASNQEIADTLFISLSTAKSHLRSIYRKLDIHGRNEAISYVIHAGLVDKVQGYISPEQKVAFP